MRKFKLLLLTVIILSGCGSNTKTQESSIATADKNITLTGKVIDGEISGATVFLDLNQNDERESYEPMTITKSDGSFTLILEKSHQQHENYLNQTAPLVAFGGMDIRTHKPFEDYLMAMTEGKDEVIISPMTTLIMQSLKEEINKDNQKLFQKTDEEIMAELQHKIDAIKQKISELLGIRVDLLTKDPIALAKKGDNTLLNKSLQLHKTAKEMKKAMRKEVRGLNKSILSSYRSLGRAFKKLKKDALKNGENALVKALDTAMSDSTVFDADLVENVKKVSTALIKSINDFWSGREVTLSDDELNSAIMSLEVITDSKSETTGTDDETETGDETGTNNGTETGTNNGTATTTPTPTTRVQALKFLRQASFRTNEAEIAYVMTNGYESWIDNQFAMVGDLDSNTDTKYGYLESTLRTMNRYNPTAYPLSVATNPTTLDEDIIDGQRMDVFRDSVFWEKALDDENQLRQRVTYALSQILVVADDSPAGKALAFRGESVINYYDILYKHSFGNYRNLLTDVTHSSAMGYFLTYIGSKADAPDENYARELTQLFTVGLYELNDDGTKQLNGGNPTPSYDQQHVTDLSKVFTGWGLDDLQGDEPRYGSTGKTDFSWVSPLKFFPQYHDSGSSLDLLGSATMTTTTNGSTDIENALNILFANHNVAPFISRHLIMRLVTSNPTPAYVGRVASVFNNNGAGVKGDLKAVIKAILLDPEARGTAVVPNFGKVDEMPIAFSHFLSQFKARPAPKMSIRVSISKGVYEPRDVRDMYWINPRREFGQTVLGAPSVFNFYSNEFIPSSAYFAQNSLVAPELELQNIPNLIGYSNLVETLLTVKDKYVVLDLYTLTEGSVRTIEDWADSTPIGMSNQALYLDLTEEYNVFEKALDNEAIANNDFASLEGGTGANDDRTRAINALLEHLDNKLFGGTMPQAYKDALLLHVQSLNYPRHDRGRSSRMRAIVPTIVRAIITSPLFMVLK